MGPFGLPTGKTGRLCFLLQWDPWVTVNWVGECQGGKREYQKCLLQAASFIKNNSLNIYVLYIPGGIVRD